MKNLELIQKAQNEIVYLTSELANLNVLYEGSRETQRRDELAKAIKDAVDILHREVLR